MRKITQQAVNAFKQSKNFKSGATEVHQRIGGTELVLHGHIIARNIDGEGLSINLCGWNTNTTRERLNGLTGVSLCTRKGIPYLNGVAISANGWYSVQ
jgi:hypothetical protein